MEAVKTPILEGITLEEQEQMRREMEQGLEMLKQMLPQK